MQEGGALQHSTAGSHSPEADSVRSASCTHSSSGKCKKRERPDHSASISKKDQCIEEYASPQKRECLLKGSDFASIIDKDGGLPSLFAVDQLIPMMWQEQSSSQRSTLAGVIVATVREDCLQQFVELRGVSVLDDWLQDGHKAKSGDGSPKDADKTMDEVIVMILQALERLPINLEALKGCSIGKSVNHLRSHRNVEIQKKARKLVDIWKKRVDFEMKHSSTSSGASDHSHQMDSMACSVHLSSAKVGEVTEVLTVPAELNNKVAESFTSTTPNASTSQNCTAEKLHEKSSVSSEKDGNNINGLCTSVSIYSLTEGENDEHSAAISTHMNCKNDISNPLECQKLEGKDLKCNSTNKNEPNRHSGSAVGITVKERTNEYRKKLRSGGSSSVPCSSDLHANAAPSHEVPMKNTMDKKNISFSMENATIMDFGMGESTTNWHSMELSARIGNSTQDSSCLRSIDVGSSKENAAEICVKDEKTDCINEICMSSQSSCSDKQIGAGPMVNFKALGGVGVEMTKKSYTNSQDFELQGSKSKSIGDTEIHTHSKLLEEYVGKEDLSCHSRKDMSSKEGLSGEHLNKSPSSEAEFDCLNANSVSERDGMVATQQDAAADAVDHEESPCSYHKEVDKVQSESAGDPFSNATVTTEKDAGLLDETAHSKNLESSMEAHQETGSEKNMLSSFCRNSREKSNIDEQVSMLSTGNHSKANDTCQSSSGTCEHAENKVKASGTSATIWSEAVVSAAVRTQLCHDFDLNEGFAVDEFSQDSSLSHDTPFTSTSNAFAASTKPMSTLSAPVAVIAATKGAFIPPSNSLNKCDVGWKGSAATSAFRPAEPRHVPAKIQTTSDKKASSMNQVRNVNNFDLNVVDQGTFEDCQNKTPLSGQHPREAHLDLNCGGEDVETEISTSSILETAMQRPSERPQKLLARPTVLDFDLNEGPDEVQQEQVVLPASASRSYTSTVRPISFGGSSRPATSGDIAILHSARSSFPLVTINMAGSEQPSCMGSMTQPTVGLMQSSTAMLAPSSSSVMYSQTTPFFGCMPVPFPANFTYNPVAATPDLPVVGPKMGMGTPVPAQGARSRANTSIARPPFVMNAGDLRGTNSFYTWGRSDQNIYSSTGPTIINYRDIGVGGKEHFVNLDGSASLEEQMRLYQQAVVPVTSLKRKGL